MSKVYDIAIIGAGLAGTLAAHCASSKVDSVLLLEKGRGMGGRLARRSQINLGADFIPKTPLTQKVLGALGLDAMAYEDEPVNQYLKSSLKDISNIDTYFSAKVDKVFFKNTHWDINTSADQKFKCRFLLSSLPQPQALELFSPYIESLNQVVYSNALTCIAMEHHGHLDALSYTSRQVGDQFKYIIKALPEKIFNDKERGRLVREQLQIDTSAHLHFWRYAFCDVADELKEQVFSELKLGFIGDWLYKGENLVSSIESVSKIFSSKFY